MDEEDSSMLVHSVNFIKGGCFVGEAHDSLMSGYGAFEWSTGVKYNGYFVENKRHGYGAQEWPDGSRFEGEFQDDNRHGRGRHKWANGEIYEGEYQFDKRHGLGSYQWPTGAKFTGSFKEDMKDGQGVYVSESGEKFEGIYKCDIRDGFGVQSYPGAGRRQDVGIWKGNKLIKLHFIISEADLFFQMETSSSTASLELPDFKHRGNYGSKGPLEMGSQALIQSAASNNCHKLRGLLQTGAIYVDVVDWLGHSALFAAAIHGHCDAVNLLLDEGADVNLLDNINLSSLLACHHLLYSSCHPQLKDALQCYAKEDGIISPTSSTSSSITEFILPSTSQSKADDAASSTHSKPLLQSRSGTRLAEKSPLSRVTSLPLLLPTSSSPVSIKQAKSSNMVKFTSLSSTLMNKGKMQSLSGNEKLSLAEKSFPSDSHIVPDDEDQINIQVSSDVEVGEMSVVLESVGSPDDLVTSQAMPHHELLMVDEVRENKEEEEGNFFSSEYGPIISAAQSTTILYSATELTASLLMDTGSTESSQTNLHGKRDIGHSINAMIDLLLLRGADPDISACPLPAIVYPILASDVAGVMRVSRKSSTQNKVGTASPLHAACLLSTEQAPAIVQCLLDHIADPNAPEFPSSQYCLTEQEMAGQVHGLASYPPLHAVCARKDAGAAKVISDLVQVLLNKGANPNIVARGHSPLSLCIINGYDEVAKLLIESGADPNLPLGRGVGTALCAVTTTEAIKKHTLATSVAMVSYLVSHGANLLQPIVTREELQPGTIMDFIYEVANEDKKLASTPYHLLNKQQRRHFRVAKKLRAYLVDLLKVTVKHRNGEKGYSGNGMKQEQLIQIREYNEEKMVTNHRRSRSALPLGSHEQFHLRIHPDQTRNHPLDLTSDSLPEGPFMSLANRHQTTDSLLPKLTRKNTTAVYPGAPQPPKVAFIDATDNNSNEQNFTPPPCLHLYSFCHYCGRSSGVRLAWCLSCQNAVYCSQSCRQSHWDEGHKTECTDPTSFKTQRRSISLKTSRVTKVVNSAKGSRTRPKSVPTASQLPYISNTKTQQRY